MAYSKYLQPCDIKLQLVAIKSYVLLGNRLAYTDQNLSENPDLRSTKQLDLESAVSCITETQTLLQKNSMKWIFFLGQGNWGTRSLTPPQ